MCITFHPFINVTTRISGFFLLRSFNSCLTNFLHSQCLQSSGYFCRRLYLKAWRIPQPLYLIEQVSGVYTGSVYHDGGLYNHGHFRGEMEDPFNGTTIVQKVQKERDILCFGMYICETCINQTWSFDVMHAKFSGKDDNQVAIFSIYQLFCFEESSDIIWTPSLHHV